MYDLQDFMIRLPLQLLFLGYISIDFSLPVSLSEVFFTSLMSKALLLRGLNRKWMQGV